MVRKAGTYYSNTLLLVLETKGIFHTQKTSIRGLEMNHDTGAKEYG